MSRSSFFSNISGDQNDQLLRHHDPFNDVDLHDLSPRASPSPPPSFYREIRSPSSNTQRSSVASGTRGSTRAGRRIQFVEPPPPITGSIAVLPIKNMDGSGSGTFVRERRARNLKEGRGVSVNDDTLLGLERRERAIQEELQELLDAQSLGLIQGFGGGGPEVSTRMGSGSSTPTTKSLQMERDRERSIKGAVPIRQPKNKVVGLRGARKGLLRDMGKLVGVKGEEEGLLIEEIERREECIERIRGWKVRIDEVRGEIGEFVSLDASNLNGERHDTPNGKSEEYREIAELKTEERAVEMEIREMEDRLLQMKARKNWLGERIKERINQRESRLSSYRGALRVVEGEVQEFLKRPPVMVSLDMGKEEGFMSLPPERRTLEMAEELWSKEITHLQERKQKVDKEREALEEGAKLWTKCIDVVVEFEDDLRVQMKSGDAQSSGSLRRQVEKMGSVIKKLAETVKVAEEKKWNLLVCAVGAELAAFMEGEEILKGAFQEMEPKKDKSEVSKEETRAGDEDGKSFDETRSADDAADDGLKEIEDDLARQEDFRINRRRVSLDREESDEEKHLRELLVDHGVEQDDGF